MSALPDVRSHLLLDILGSIRVQKGKMSDDSQGRMKRVENLPNVGLSLEKEGDILFSGLESGGKAGSRGGHLLSQVREVGELEIPMRWNRLSANDNASRLA